MRIAHVTATFPPYRGGTGNVCLAHARELARRGHEVSVFTAAVTGAPPYEQREGFVVNRLRPLVRIGNAPVLPGLSTSLKGFDLIHLHYPFILGAELVRAATHLWRTPLIVSFHNDLIGDGARAYLFEAYQRLSAVLTVRSAARLCAVSLDHYQSSRLRSLLPEKHSLVVELPNGVDTGLFCPPEQPSRLRTQLGIPPDAPLLLFVAALDRAHYFKGLDRLLRAFQQLPRQSWLLVIGDGDARTSYEALATSLGVAERTIFVGAINHNLTPAYFGNADLTVLPSSPPESFGLVLIESLACGTPVVASNIPGVRTVVDHGRDGLLVPEGDIPALAHSIELLLADRVQRQSMAQQGRCKVEARYSWPTIGAQLEAIYQQVLAESAPQLLQTARSKP